MSDLVGSWKLVSVTVKGDDGSVLHPFGDHPEGIITYTDNGCMSAQIMKPGRPSFCSGQRFEGTPEEIKAAFDGYLAYYGTYRIEAEKGVVVHQVIASLFPNWTGNEQKRFFEVSGSSMTLRTPKFKIGDKSYVGIDLWQQAD